MEWKGMGQLTQDKVALGAVFRCEGREPYEKLVDFMLVEYPESPSGLAFVVASGAHAGRLLVKLPKESRPADSLVQQVSLSWLRQHWSRWVYEGAVEKVRVCSHFEAPSL